MVRLISATFSQYLARGCLAIPFLWAATGSIGCATPVPFALPNAGADGLGGDPSTSGGAPDFGGAPAIGGDDSSGGSIVAGGDTSSAGMSSGGASNSAGANTFGGAPTFGGSSNSAGAPAGGGGSAGKSGTGGSGGSATAGSPGSAGAAAAGATGSAGSTGGGMGCAAPAWVSMTAYKNGDVLTGTCQVAGGGASVCVTGTKYAWTCIGPTCGFYAPGADGWWANWTVGTTCN